MSEEYIDAKDLIGRKIRMATSYRSLLRIGFIALAEKRGIDAKLANSYYFGLKAPLSQDLIKVAKILDVNVSWLLTPLEDICEMLTVRWRRENLKERS